VIPHNESDLLTNLQLLSCERAKVRASPLISSGERYNEPRITRQNPQGSGCLSEMDALSYIEKGMFLDALTWKGECV